MVEPSTGDTWGLSGPTLLQIYGLLALVVGGYWLLVRRQSRAAQPGKPWLSDLTNRPHDLAFLNGGAPLAVFSTLSAMRLQGWITPSAGRIHRAGSLGSGANDLERAIHAVVATPTHRSALPAQPAVRSALDASAERLVRAGLLVSEDARQRLRRIAFGMVAVVGLGVLRLVAGIEAGNPVGYLVLELIVVAAAAGGMYAATPWRTRLGDEVLADLRLREHDLNPKSKPDWTVYGPAAAALGVGLFGVNALWASDPALAADLEARRAAASSYFPGGGGDGGAGDSGGGGGGCGGGCGG